MPSTLIVDGVKVNRNGSDKCVKSFTQDGVGTWKVNSDGTVKFTPEASFTGVTVIQYQIKDTAGDVLTNTLTVRVKAGATDPDGDGDGPDGNGNEDTNCSDDDSQQDAQDAYDAGGHNDLDGDNDGIACEDNDDDGGLLPGTGGPALWIGLLGLLLLLTGGAVLIGTRTRE